MASIVVVRRKDFELDLYVRWPLRRVWKLRRTYPIAVGMKGLATPAGMFEVLHKARHPTYTYGDYAWVRELEDLSGRSLVGTVIPADDPDNPVAPRWIGISDDEGIGLHGTNAPESIGTRASHGCIRLRPDDIKALYRTVHKGTPVFVY